MVKLLSAIRMPVLVILLVMAHSIRAQDPKTDSYTPKIAPASKEGQQAIQRFRIPKGMRVDLVAAEPLLANPVAFCFNDQGNIFVVETFRMKAGVTDNRDHMDWLNDDLSSRTVADRLEMYRKYLGKRYSTYGVEDDRLKLLRDTDGNGVMDQANVFASGFRRPSDGIGAGVLASGNNVWFACIPDLWLLTDSKGVGKSDRRVSLHSGYGVHVSFFGHDLHGLTFGPDGRIYFSIGDRGLHVETEGRILDCPDTGAVLRCNPDGSNLELFATGLRNPQKLAFDKYGNLFTCDNNADSGDRARWVHLVEGGDSGWRIGYQYLHGPGAYLGPWNAEKLWYTSHAGEAAYRLPPVAHVAQGPSGLAYHPGVALLPDRCKEHFFLCDFRGEASRSGIYEVTLKPKGASFEVSEWKQFVWSVLVTDTNFGPDGALYFCDWVEGWDKTGKGRIYKVSDVASPNKVQAAEVRQLLAADYATRAVADLLGQLGHADLRIRQKAQFTLAARGKEAVAGLKETAVSNKNQLARIHALWALGQIWRKQIPAENDPAFQAISLLTKDADEEIRAQSAKLFGEIKLAATEPRLLELLKDKSLRVRFFAATSLGKLQRSSSISAILEMLRENKDADVYLRHAGVMALTWIHDGKALVTAAKDPAASVRLASLLAMRRLQMPDIAELLRDTDPLIATEAVRAIHDVPIDAAMPQLAQLPSRPDVSEMVTYRVINANLRVGAKQNAEILASYAASSKGSTSLRTDALKALGEWAAPPAIDRVVGLFRPVKSHPAADAKLALRKVMREVLGGPDEVCAEGARLAGKFEITEAGDTLMKLMGDKSRSSAVRIESLRSLALLKEPKLKGAIHLVLADSDPSLRIEGRHVLAKSAPELAIPELEKTLQEGKVQERQDAFTTLAGISLPNVDKILAHWIDLLMERKVSAEVQLDLLEAARRRPAQEIQSRLSQFETRRPKSDPLSFYRETQFGGDSEKGRRIYQEKSALSCVRCHKLKKNGGEVGPDLSDVGKRLDRENLLESLVTPNKKIAKGFETIVLSLTNGTIVTGISKSEDAKKITLMNADGKLITVQKADIEERTRGQSSMPADLIQKMSKSELRDLIEFLSSRK